MFSADKSRFLIEKSIIYHMSQIFNQENVPLDKLVDFLHEICVTGKSKTSEYFILTPESYKRACFNNVASLLTSFLDFYRPYYFNSKKYYVNRKQSYKRLVTVVRQICRINHVAYTFQMKYDKSDYAIVYYIYLTKDSSSNSSNATLTSTIETSPSQT